MERNLRDFRRFEEIACSTKEDCEKIKKHLQLAFAEFNLNFRIKPAHANKFRLYVTVNALEYALLTLYLKDAKINGVRIWNY